MFGWFYKVCLFSYNVNDVSFLAVALASVAIAVALAIAALVVAEVAIVEIVFTVTYLLVLKYKLVYGVSNCSNGSNCAESDKDHLAVLRLFGFMEQTHNFILREI